MKESDLMPDFFLDLDTTPKEPIAAVPNPAMKSEPAPAAAPPPAADGKTVQAVFDKLGTLINEELVSKVNAVYTFNVKGNVDTAHVKWNGVPFHSKCVTN